MKFRNRRRAFLFVILSALVVEIGFSLAAIHRSLSSEKTKRSVIHTYEVLDEIAGMNLAFRNYLYAHLRSPALADEESILSLREHYTRLSEMTFDDPIEIERLKAFEFLRNGETIDKLDGVLRHRFTELTTILMDARETELDLLRARLTADEKAAASSRLRTYLSVGFNAAFMLLAVFLWFSAERLRVANEASLKAAINASEKAREEVQRAVVSKSGKFRSTVHDLKNPLGAIKGFSDLIELEKNNPVGVEEMSRRLQRLSDHTLSLVNTLLDVERPGAPLVERPSNVNLFARLEDVCSAVQPQAAKKQQSIVLNFDRHDIEVKGDPRKIWDAFMNVVGNAVKFAPRRSSIRVSSITSDREVRVEVEDEGPGFSAADRKRAFGPYCRLSARPTGGESSTGLGLSIVKATVEAMGGKITIGDRSPKPGAKLIINLPLA